MKFNYLKLKEIREMKGINQDQIARSMHWELKELEQRENGMIDVGVDELHQLAELLEVDDLRVFFEN